MSVRPPSSSILWAYLLFLFVGVPIIVFLTGYLTGYLKVPAGLAVASGEKGDASGKGLAAAAVTRQQVQQLRDKAAGPAMVRLTVLFEKAK